MGAYRAASKNILIRPYLSTGAQGEGNATPASEKPINFSTALRNEKALIDAVVRDAKAK